MLANLTGISVISNYPKRSSQPSCLRIIVIFRRGIGSGWSGLDYAVGQIFWTHTDSDRTQFNYSEIPGNPTAGGFKGTLPGQPERHQLGNEVSLQLCVDMASDVFREFWPAVSRKFQQEESYSIKTVKQGPSNKPFTVSKPI